MPLDDDDDEDDDDDISGAASGKYTIPADDFEISTKYEMVS